MRRYSSINKQPCLKADTSMKLVFFIALAVSGCSIKVHKFQEFDASKSVEVEEWTIGRVYKQNGEMIKADEMAEHFKKSPATATVMDNHTLLFWSAVILSGVGSGFIGHSLGTAWAGGDANLALAGAGAAILGGSYYLATEADDKVIEAVRMHNESLQKAEGRTTWLRFSVAQW